MKMKHFSLSVMVVLFFCQTAAEERIDTLPLGSAPFRFDIQQISADSMLDTRSNAAITIDQIVETSKKTKVFIIGEYHDNYQCHTFQRDFIEALYQANPQLVVGFEFFTPADNESLELWIRGDITDEALIQQTGWYKRSGLNFGYTKMVLDILKKRGIKAIGLNVPRSIVRQVSTKGFDSLPEETKARFPTIHVPSTDHRYYIQTIFGKMAVQMEEWFNNTYMAQKCWDVIMAESMKQFLSQKSYRKHVGVIIAGSAHVAFKLGIPFRYKLADKRAAVTTIIPIPLPKTDSSTAGQTHPMMMSMGGSAKPSALFSRGIGDFVFSVAQPARPHFPSYGLTSEETDNGLTVKMVSPGGLANKAGLKKGDFIRSLDGTEVNTVEDFRTLLAAKGWDDSVQITLTKKITLSDKGDKKKAVKKTMGMIKK